jgi:hypothetical protein
VSGTGGAALVVRQEPGGQAIGELTEGAAVVVLEGPMSDADGRPWYRCMQHGDEGITGWVAGSYLEVHP